jgi:hypothetical protein
MRLMDRWFNKKPPVRPAPPVSRVDPSRDDTRRQLLAMAVRDTLIKHGIPSHWISVEPVPAATSARVPGMHLRLVVREWNPDLLAYTVALQRAIQARLIRLDALSHSWIAGVSWKYEVVDDSTCPALPPPQHWDRSRTPVMKPLAAAPAPAAAAAPVPASRAMPAALADHIDFRPTEPMGQR